MPMLTLCVPHRCAAEPHDGAGAHADRVIARMEQVAPGFTSLVLHLTSARRRRIH